VFSGFLRVLILSLLTAAFAFSPLHAQTVAYVANNSSNSVSVIDTACNTVTATIPVGNHPVGIAFSPDDALAYVTNGRDGTISVIDTATHSVTTTIALVPSPNPVAPISPAYLAVTPDGKTLYVPTGSDPVPSFQVVSTATNTATAVIPLGGLNVEVLAVTPDGKHVYVVSENNNATFVFVIDTATNTVVAQLTVPGALLGPGVAITPSGSTVYVAPGDKPLVTAINTANNTVMATIPIPTAAFPSGVAITPDGTRAYVADLGGEVFVIDTASNTVVATISTPLVQPFALAVTPDGALVYVANPSTNNVSVIATATNTVVATVPVGSAPLGVATAIVNMKIPLAAFTIDNLNISPQGFHEQGDFTLGASCQGVDLAHQAVTLTIGSFSLTIPAGSFLQVGGNHHFELNATINGFEVAFDLKANHGSSTDFSYVVNVSGVDLTSQPNPVTVGLTIGHNTGTTTVQF
jgi:YVTN family beta-propeller protein